MKRTRIPGNCIEQEPAGTAQPGAHLVAPDAARDVPGCGRYSTGVGRIGAVERGRPIGAAELLFGLVIVWLAAKPAGEGWSALARRQSSVSLWRGSESDRACWRV